MCPCVEQEEFHVEPSEKKLQSAPLLPPDFGGTVRSSLDSIANEREQLRLQDASFRQLHHRNKHGRYNTASKIQQHVNPRFQSIGSDQGQGGGDPG